MLPEGLEQWPAQWAILWVLEAVIEVAAVAPLHRLVAFSKAGLLVWQNARLASDVTPFAFWYEGDPDGGCIRFLTETESERLMGLPEGWTKYGADGEEIRPLQRYKALGNAIALPCADYIMAGIYEVLADRDGKED